MTYYHQLSPFIIQFTETIGLRWYSMAYILAIVFVYVLGLYLIRKKRVDLPLDQLGDMVVYGALGAIIGGRLGFCLFYSPDLFLSFDFSGPQWWKNFPFWGALKIHQGGMSSHGGILGFLISMLLYAYRKRVSFFYLMDLGALAGAFGIFLGRIANFINGELYGRVVEGQTWLAVRFPAEILLWSSDPKTYKEQLSSLKDIAASVDSAILEVSSAELWLEWVHKASLGLDSVYNRYISYICQLIYQSSYSAPVNSLLEPLLSLRYPSQLYQSFFGGFLPFVIMVLCSLKLKKPGMMSLVFIFSYLSFRIFTEFYRQPDMDIGFQFLNLTRGQWLSILLYTFSLIYAYFIYKQTPKGFIKK